MAGNPIRLLIQRKTLVTFHGIYIFWNWTNAIKIIRHKL